MNVGARETPDGVASPLRVGLFAGAVHMHHQIAKREPDFLRRWIDADRGDNFTRRDAVACLGTREIAPGELRGGLELLIFWRELIAKVTEPVVLAHRGLRQVFESEVQIPFGVRSDLTEIQPTIERGSSVGSTGSPNSRSNAP